MTSQSRDFPGHLQAGGQESGAPWTEARFTLAGDDVILTVNEIEVARLSGATITDTGQGDVYLIEGADEPLFFRPGDPAAFREAVTPPMSTAERIAAASAEPQDATLVMEPIAEPPGPEPTDEVSTPWWRRWWLIIATLALLLILLVAFCGDGETGTSTTTTLAPGVTTSVAGTTTPTTLPGTTTVPDPTSSTAAPTTSAPSTTTTATTAPTSTTGPPVEPAFGSGTHIVGEDVQPGIYETGIVSGPFGCYWERLSGLSGEIDDIIANGNVANHDVVEIMAEDAAFGTDCEAWYPLTEIDPLMTSIPEGKWVLGTHITPGAYETPGGDACYWERLSGVSGTPDDVIANDLPSGQAIVEIDPGDFAFNSLGCGDWAPRP